jgi:outer membrane protein OmpA-like peptidoglycan-associated protein
MPLGKCSEEPLSLRRFVSVLLISAVALCTPSQLSAQDSGVPTEVFSGYSGYRTGGIVNGVKLPAFAYGWATQIIYHGNRWGGFVMDVSGHYNSVASAHDLAFGPRFQLPLRHFTPFVEATVGIQHLSAAGSSSQNSATYTFGGGVDVKVNSRFSVRPFQLSYVNTSYSSLSPSGSQGNHFNGIRAQAGVIYTLDSSSSAGDVRASCSAEPSTVDPGVNVKIGVTPKGFRHKPTLHYSYTTTGGTISGSTETEAVDTAGVKPGTYTVTATVAQGEGKHHYTANCQANFNVNAQQTPPPPVKQQTPPPPVTAQQTPPPPVKQQPPPPPVAAQQVPPPPVKQQTPPPPVNAQQTPPPPVTAQQTPPPPVTAQQVPPLPGKAGHNSKKSENRLAATNPAQPPVKGQAQKPAKFGIIKFNRDAKRPTRVDNEAKAELDRYADALAAKPDTNGIVVGHAITKGSRANKNSIASQRAINTKDYVCTQKGIDPARIEPRTGSADRQTTELWVVPAAATFPAKGTTVVDEKKVKAIPRVPLAHRKPRKNAHKRPPKSVHWSGAEK